MRLTTCLFYHRSGFLSSLIFQKLLNFLNLEYFKHLSVNRELVGVRPLHLAFARPLRLLERPTGAIHCFRNRKAFQRLLVLFKGFLLRLRKSFFCLSAWRSSIIPYPPPPCQHFLTTFFIFFLALLKNVHFLVFNVLFLRKKPPAHSCTDGLILLL